MVATSAHVFFFVIGVMGFLRASWLAAQNNSLGGVEIEILVSFLLMWWVEVVVVVVVLCVSELS